jgi:autophagy-related protein 2
MQRSHYSRSPLFDIPKAVNELLSGLPLKLHDGFASSVVAHIPWPNPLTSAIGLSIDSLNLTLHINPATRQPDQVIQNLSESVLSAAENFIHDELTPREEAALRESFHPDTQVAGETPDVPGGLDPFGLPSADEELYAEHDPAGVSIFATLIERILARFQFDLSKATITLVYPTHFRVIIKVAEVRYRTVVASAEEESLGETRSVTISGFSISAANLCSPRPFTQSPSPTSPSSSSSSLDEDTHFAMSQSLAGLPPPAASPTNSVASSLYHSAIYDASTAPRTDLEAPNFTGSSSDEIFLHLGSQPLVFQLKTPSITSRDVRTLDMVQFSVTAGTIALAFRPWHLQMINTLASVISPPFTAPTATVQEKPAGLTASIFSISAELHLRGLTCLVLPSPTEESDRLDSYFAHPLTLPQLPQTYLRILAEDIGLFWYNKPDNELRAGGESPKHHRVQIRDASILVVRSSSAADNISALPMLITDPHLSEGTYLKSPENDNNNDPFVLPTFKVTDFTDVSNSSTKPKVSQWRTPFSRKAAEQPGSFALVLSLNEAQGKVTSTMSRSQESVTHLHAMCLPMHIFLDARLLKDHIMTDYANELEKLSKETMLIDNQSPPITPPGTPRLGPVQKVYIIRYSRNSLSDAETF